MPTDSQLPRSEPESFGVDGGSIERWLTALDDANIELHSFMLVRDGKVLAEGWWKPYRATDPHLLYSLSKSFCSTAVGFAVAEGFFQLTDKVVSFFESELPSEVPENLALMTIHDLLTMSTGHDSEPDMRGQNDPAESWAAAFLHHPVAHRPGTHFLYNSAATYMASAIVQKTTGATLTQYLQARLYEKLGISQHPWQQSPQGIDVGGWGMSLTTESIAKFGQLLLNDGVWQGDQVLPAGWVATATAKQVSNGDDPNNDWNQGYGYQFWRCRHGAYRGDGAFGQNCIVMPNQNAVLATTANASDLGAIMSTFWENVLPNLGGSPASSASLGSTLANLDLAPTGEPSGMFTGSFVSGSNSMRIADDLVELHTDGIALKAGLGSWIETDVANYGRLAGAAAWQGDVLRVKFRDTGSPFSLDVVCQLEGPDASVQITQSGTFWSQDRSFKGTRQGS
jgi:CubicO group peptidase (beta-lactamase class C family)